jgi:hypothetical protein
MRVACDMPDSKSSETIGVNKLTLGGYRTAATGEGSNEPLKKPVTHKRNNLPKLVASS